MFAVVTVNEPSAFTLVTVRPVRTLVEAVVPAFEPTKKFEEFMPVPTPPLRL
jgi:hypothetical protein